MERAAIDSNPGLQPTQEELDACIERTRLEREERLSRICPTCQLRERDCKFGAADAHLDYCIQCGMKAVKVTAIRKGRLVYGCEECGYESAKDRPSTGKDSRNLPGVGEGGAGKG